MIERFSSREAVIGHGDRVVILGALIAEALNLDELRIVKLRVACLLHDIGKIVIPDGVIDKPGPLNDDEFAVVKSHSMIGQKILTELGLVEQATWVRHHHERIDGSGYPDGLKGERIPLESRIILVADAFDAITSDRAYRTSRSATDAVEEIQRHAGVQFDRGCVEALTAVHAASAR